MKGRVLSYVLIITIIVFSFAMLPIALDMRENYVYIVENSNTNYIEKKVETNSSSLIIIIAFETENIETNLSEHIKYDIALIPISFYEQWTKTGKNTSLIPPDYILAQGITSAEISKTYESMNSFVLIIWSENREKSDIQLSLIVIPSNDIQVLAVIGVIIALSTLILLIIILVNLLSFLLFRKKEKPLLKERVNSSSSNIIISQESNSQYMPEKQRTNNNGITKKAGYRYEQRPLLEQIDDTIQLFTEKELLLLSIALVIFFTSLFGAAFIPGDMGNFVRGFGMICAFLIAGLFGVHFLLRRKKKQELISYLELRKRAKIEDIKKIFDLDLLSLQQLILEINHETPGRIKIIGDFEELAISKYVKSITQNTTTSSLKQEDKKMSTLSERVCPFCGAENDDNAVFCSQCGASLIPPK